MVEIIYEDNHLLLLNKPAGLLTQPSGTAQPNLEDEAKAWIKERNHKPGGVFLHAVHRLDRPVGGIILFAKSQKALSRLQEASRDKKMQKIYLALIEGDAPQESLLENYLLQGNFSTQVVEKNTHGAKLAQLHLRLVEKGLPFSLLEIELRTGRYHQIRAQLAAIGCPIIGDQKYGSNYPWKKEGIALQHVRLQFSHPITQQLLTFSIPSQLNL